MLAGIPNDAMNIRYLRRDPAEADALLAMMRANVMMQDGIRLKDMPDSLFTGAQADGRQRGPISSSLDIMLLCRAIDMHDFTLAGRLPARRDRAPLRQETALLCQDNVIVATLVGAPALCLGTPP